MDLAILTFGGGERYRLLFPSQYFAAAFTLEVQKKQGCLAIPALTSETVTPLPEAEP